MLLTISCHIVSHKN